MASRMVKPIAASFMYIQNSFSFISPSDDVGKQDDSSLCMEEQPYVIDEAEMYESRWLRRITFTNSLSPFSYLYSFQASSYLRIELITVTYSQPGSPVYTSSSHAGGSSIK